MTKITADHLDRSAFVYIRQSTADQLLHNLESRRRQYGLADRARQLGWTMVEVIDDDLGRSGGGINRPGFERLLAAICEGRVGAVFAIEASRLARNGRDWHTLIEFCGLVGTIIIDEDGIYDPRHPNDRLLLGMKGTMSELELSLFRQRSHEALKQKARRGALFLGVAAGYVRIGRDRIEKDPDQRVQDALRLVFAKFAEFQSVRQVHVWLRDEGIALPVACHKAAEGRSIAWRLPLYNTVHNILTNPVFAGAYAFGRTMSKVSVEDGRKRVNRGLRRPLAEWDVLLKDQHEGYISWSEFERNQQVIADNATGKGSAAVRGAVRRGELLLAGLLRCGHCGRKLYVGYGGKAGRYYCQGALVNHGTERCISFGGLRADHAVGSEVLRVLKPLGINVQIQQIDANTAHNNVQAEKYEMAFSLWTMDIPDPDELATFALDPNAGSKSFFTNYNNPTVVKAVHDAELTTVPSARQADYNTAQTDSAQDAFLALHRHSPTEDFPEGEELRGIRAPTLIIHGDADFLVPIQQSKLVIDKMKELKVPCELVVKKGAGHGWPDLLQDVNLLADWFDKYLAKGKPAYVPQKWATLEQAVTWIRTSGGSWPTTRPVTRLLPCCCRRPIQSTRSASCRMARPSASPCQRRWMIATTTRRSTCCRKSSTRWAGAPPSKWLSDISLPARKTTCSA